MYELKFPNEPLYNNSNILVQVTFECCLQMMSQSQTIFLSMIIMIVKVLALFCQVSLFDNKIASNALVITMHVVTKRRKRRSKGRR